MLTESNAFASNTNKFNTVNPIECPVSLDKNTCN